MRWHLLGLLWMFSAPAAGDPVGTRTSTRVLFVARALPEAERQPLMDAVALALSAEVLDDHAVEAALVAEAARLGPDPELEAQALLARAKNEFVELRVAAARRTFDRALSILLGSDRAPASPRAVATVFFERGLLELASKERAAAAADLRVAAGVDPTLSASPDRYGPPALRALEDARRALRSSPEVELLIDKAPADAIVELNGQVVGREARARGPGPHLITVHRPGYLARSELVVVDKRSARRAFVLAPAEGPALAKHALEGRREGGRPAAGGEAGLWVVRSLSITRLVEAIGQADGAVDLSLLDGASGAVLRAVHGARADWEPYPWAQLAMALAGRSLSPPPAPSLSLGAPVTVEPGGAIRLEVELSDPGGRVERLLARCGPAAGEILPRGSGRFHFELLAPSDGSVECAVEGLGARGALVRAPPPGSSAEVRVEALSSPWYKSWIVWSAIGGAVVGGAALTFVLTRPPEQVLVIHGP